MKMINISPLARSRRPVFISFDFSLNLCSKRSPVWQLIGLGSSPFKTHCWWAKSARSVAFFSGLFYMSGYCVLLCRSFEFSWVVQTADIFLTYKTEFRLRRVCSNRLATNKDFFDEGKKPLSLKFGVFLLQSSLSSGVLPKESSNSSEPMKPNTTFLSEIDC